MWQQEGNFELLNTYDIYVHIIKTEEKSNHHLCQNTAILEQEVGIVELYLHTFMYLVITPERRCQ